jgi:hypothetical protein
MPTCAVCPDFVAEASAIPEMMTDVLYQFLQENEFRLAVDRSGKIYELFIAAAVARDEGSRHAVDAWIRLLARMHHRAVERVNYSGRSNSRSTFTLGLARRIRGQALLIIWSMQDYDEEKLRESALQVADRHQAVKLFRDSNRRGSMIDIAAAGLAIKTIASAVGTVDKIYDVYKKFRERGEVSDPTKSAPLTSAETVTVTGENNELIHTVHGREAKRVSRDELSKLLSKDDLTFVATYEKRMSDLYAQWIDVSREIELANGMQRAQLKGQIGTIADRIGECLRAILDFLPKIGFTLDDHYAALRSIAGSASKG